MSSCSSTSCQTTSVGSAGQLFATLIQTIMAAQCGYADQWPEDYGETALRDSMFSILFHILLNNILSLDFFSKLLDYYSNHFYL